MEIAKAFLRLSTTSSNKVKGRSLFFSGMNVTTISFWLYLTNRTFVLYLSRIIESERQLEIFSMDFLFWGCKIEPNFVNSAFAVFAFFVRTIDNASISCSR
jgi:hypothetical protein